jgi:ArsR family transcriptional regulator
LVTWESLGLKKYEAKAVGRQEKRKRPKRGGALDKTLAIYENIIIYENNMKDFIRIFKALSDPTRLRIFLLLMEKDLCVCELTYVLEMSQSRISHQLRLLRDADVVEDIREGRWIIYRIPDRMRTVLQPLIEQFAREDLTDSWNILKDIERLDICLRDEVRRKLGRPAALSGALR